MEPGTFKDRLLLEGDPHQLIEGMIVRRMRFRPMSRYIFLRWAYKLAAERLEQAIAEAYRHGYLGQKYPWLGVQPRAAPARQRRAATCAARRPALLNALEGKRAQSARQAAVSAR